MKPFRCKHCGNERDLLPQICPFCDEVEAPEALAPYAKLDLDRGGLRADEALARFEGALRLGAESGLKWLVVLHGYGSSGSGGRIRDSLRRGLEDNHWADRIWDSLLCEQVRTRSDLDALLGGSRADIFRCMEKERLLGNPGASILLFRRDHLV